MSYDTMQYWYDIILYDKVWCITKGFGTIRYDTIRRNTIHTICTAQDCQVYNVNSLRYLKISLLAYHKFQKAFQEIIPQVWLVQRMAALHFLEMDIPAFADTGVVAGMKTVKNSAQVAFQERYQAAFQACRTYASWPASSGERCYPKALTSMISVWWTLVDKPDGCSWRCAKCHRLHRQPSGRRTPTRRASSPCRRRAETASEWKSSGATCLQASCHRLVSSVGCCLLAVSLVQPPKY